MTTPSNVLPLHLKQTFLPIIWIFTEGKGDGIKFRLPFDVFFFTTITFSYFVNTYMYIMTSIQKLGTILSNQVLINKTVQSVNNKSYSWFLFASNLTKHLTQNFKQTKCFKKKRHQENVNNKSGIMITDSTYLPICFLLLLAYHNRRYLICNEILNFRNVVLFSSSCLCPVLAVSVLYFEKK